MTRGSFYFHVRSRDDLLASLLDRWRVRNVEPFRDSAAAADAAGQARMERIVDLWLTETLFDPRLELAMRDWAHGSPTVAAELRAVDVERIELLQCCFREMGFGDEDAFARGRLTHFSADSDITRSRLPRRRQSAAGAPRSTAASCSRRREPVGYRHAFEPKEIRLAAPIRPRMISPEVISGLGSTYGH